MYLARLDNDVIFKKAFSDKLVLTQFIKDILGIDIHINKIETDKRFNPKIAYINFAYDVFTQSEDERVIVEIQRVNYDYNFDRFLHYHTMAIAELQRRARDYKVKQTVYTIVIITAADVITDRAGQPVQYDELILDFNPRTRRGQPIDFCGHQLIFLNPNFRNEETPPSYVDWFDLVHASIHYPENPPINLHNQAIQKAVTLIEEDNLTPEERHAAKITAATEQTLRLYENKGKQEGKQEGRQEGRQETLLEIAKKMKAKGLAVKTIAEMTQLEVEMINQIKID